MTKKKKLPNIFKMATNFAKELGKYIKEGAPNVTHAQYTKRLEACIACPNLDQETVRCTLCGCHMEHKAKWLTATCPDKPSRWEATYKPPGLPPSEDARKAQVANKILHKALDSGLWDPKKPNSAKPILKSMGWKYESMETHAPGNCKDCDKEEKENVRKGTKSKGKSKGRKTKKKDNSKEKGS